MYLKHITMYKYTWCWKFSIVCCIYLAHNYPSSRSPYAAGRRNKSLKYGIIYVNIAKYVVRLEVKNNTHFYLLLFLWNGMINSSKLFCYRVVGHFISFIPFSLHYKE